MHKNIIQLFLFSVIMSYFVSCASGENDYKLLTKDDRINIDSFCFCSASISVLRNQFGNLKDSAEAYRHFDTLFYIMRQLQICTGYLAKLKPDKSTEKEFETEMMAYLKKTHPDCYSFLIDKEYKDK